MTICEISVVKKSATFLLLCEKISSFLASCWPGAWRNIRYLQLLPAARFVVEARFAAFCHSLAVLPFKLHAVLMDGICDHTVFRLKLPPAWALS